MKSRNRKYCIGDDIDFVGIFVNVRVSKYRVFGRNIWDIIFR